MSFVGVWFCVIGTIYVLNSVVKTLLKAYEIFSVEEEEEEMSEDIRKTMYS